MTTALALRSNESIIDLRPTRPARPVPSGPRESARTDRIRSLRTSGDGRRPAVRQTAAPRAVGRPCDGMPRAASRSVYARRRAWAAGIVAGIGLALTVFVVGLVGNGIQEASTPSAIRTEVVHVRSGESVGDVAARVAPSLPKSVVVEKIMTLNGMKNSALTAGQPLLAPVYSR